MICRQALWFAQTLFRFIRSTNETLQVTNSVWPTHILFRFVQVRNKPPLFRFVSRTLLKPHSSLTRTLSDSSKFIGTHLTLQVRLLSENETHSSSLSCKRPVRTNPTLEGRLPKLTRTHTLFRVVLFVQTPTHSYGLSKLGSTTHTLQVCLLVAVCSGRPELGPFKLPSHSSDLSKPRPPTLQVCPKAVRPEHSSVVLPKQFVQTPPTLQVRVPCDSQNSCPLWVVGFFKVVRSPTSSLSTSQTSSLLNSKFIQSATSIFHTLQLPSKLAVQSNKSAHLHTLFSFFSHSEPKSFKGLNISGNMGLVSAGRIDKDTPPLTTPSHTSKSSAMDISS